MIYLKTPEEIETMRSSALLISQCLGEVARNIQPGVSTRKLDTIAREYILDNGGKPACLGYEGFPATLCIEVNETVVHGFPSEDVILKEGDIVSFDVGTVYEGFYGDAARTFAVGEVSPEAARLLRVTEESLALAVAEARPGNELNDIAGAVQKHAEGAGFHVVRRFVGHGIGSTLHEKPEVPNYVVTTKPALPLKTGMVLCIEPMITVGTPEVEILDDKWSAVTRDRSLAAHFEHCVAILPGGPQILDLP